MERRAFPCLPPSFVSVLAAVIQILLLFLLLLRIFMYVFLSGLGLLVIIGLHQLLESRKVIHQRAPTSGGGLVGQN